MSFDEFWTVYPRKKEKIAARTAYDKAIKKHGTHDEIMAGARKYAAEVAGRDQKFTKHPASWLNAGCWMDYELAPRTEIQAPLVRVPEPCSEFHSLTGPPRPPRTPEEQARVDAQVEELRNLLGSLKKISPATAIRRDRNHYSRIKADLEMRRTKNEMRGA